MITQIWTKHSGGAAIGFGLAGAAIYMVMITVTLARLETFAGDIPFDLRPFGYGPQAAGTLLQALGPEGRAYYLGRQIPLDMVYPALLGATLVSMIMWFGRQVQARGLARVGIVVSIGAAGIDYVENLGVIAMILSWPAVVEPLVYATGAATVAKSVLTVLAVSITLIAGVIWARHRVAGGVPEGAP